MKQGLKIGDNVVNKFYSFAHGMISIIITFLFSSQKPVIIFSSKLIEVISLLSYIPTRNISLIRIFERKTISTIEILQANIFKGLGIV